MHKGHIYLFVQHHVEQSCFHSLIIGKCGGKSLAFWGSFYGKVWDFTLCNCSGKYKLTYKCSEFVWRWYTISCLTDYDMCHVLVLCEWEMVQREIVSSAWMITRCESNFYIKKEGFESYTWLCVFEISHVLVFLECDMLNFIWDIIMYWVFPIWWYIILVVFLVLIIFNEGAYLTVKSIFHKNLN